MEYPRRSAAEELRHGSTKDPFGGRRVFIVPLRNKKRSWRLVSTDTLRRNRSRRRVSPDTLGGGRKQGKARLDFPLRRWRRTETHQVRSSGGTHREKHTGIILEHNKRILGPYEVIEGHLRFAATEGTRAGTGAGNCCKGDERGVTPELPTYYFGELLPADRRLKLSLGE